jgi:integrase
MALGKQAKILTKAQVDAVLGRLDKTRYPARNRAILLLSVKAGLRAKEIASITWDMVTDSEGNVSRAIHLQDVASKGRSGRVVPMNRDLHQALNYASARAVIAWRKLPEFLILGESHED